MKTIGIVVDNYKLDKFKKELAKVGLTNYTLVPFINDSTSIKILIEDADFQKSVSKIHALSIKVESHFKRSN